MCCLIDEKVTSNFDNQVKVLTFSTPSWHDNLGVSAPWNSCYSGGSNIAIPRGVSDASLVYLHY